MAAAAKTQLRGNCQHCGRDHAVVRGSMSKHGYEVKNGYFAGICQGDRHEPMQVSRVQTDSIIIAVLAQSDREDARSNELESGRETLGLVRKPGEYLRRGEEPTMVEWKDLPVWDARDVLKAAVWNLRNHAKAGRQFANDLGKVADAVHGQPLREVARAAGPAPILSGEKRITTLGAVLTVSRVDGGRVYWTRETDTRSFKGWTGTQAWRKLEMAPDTNNKGN